MTWDKKRILQLTIMIIISTTLLIIIKSPNESTEVFGLILSGTLLSLLISWLINKKEKK